ncbi:hypothetical protein M9H77_22521 [Catharanthus roseus]|uniref:Uncharacterized protein n=1 Tax=Catharanthus roseus TaxID=4058 RepID=A0ACC0ATC3_CATRO|nr:hypothetical protein M9H77_22521 [Catharanthus roseus]
MLMRRSCLVSGHCLRVVRQFRCVQCISAHPIRPLEYRRPPNNIVYMTSVPVVPPSRCNDNYMSWFLSRSHPRIQNPKRLPRGVPLPSATPISLQVLVDMISREVDRKNIDSDMKIGRISDMLKKYDQPRR